MSPNHDETRQQLYTMTTNAIIDSFDYCLSDRDLWICGFASFNPKRTQFVAVQFICWYNKISMCVVQAALWFHTHIGMDWSWDIVSYIIQFAWCYLVFTAPFTTPLSDSIRWRYSFLKLSLPKLRLSIRLFGSRPSEISFRKSYAHESRRKSCCSLYMKRHENPHANDTGPTTITQHTIFSSE